MTSRGGWFYLATACVALAMSAGAAVKQESISSVDPSEATRTGRAPPTRQAEPGGITLNPDSTPSSTSADSKALKRLLRLKDGRVLRVIASAEDGGWRVKHGQESTLVPIAAVESVRLEREVLAELAIERKKVGPRDVDGRIALASWMLDRGLASEAQRELDLLLADSPRAAWKRDARARDWGPPDPAGTQDAPGTQGSSGMQDPDEARVVAFLREDSVGDRFHIAWPEAGPDELRATLEMAAHSKPTVRELALARLAERIDADVLCASFSRDLVNTDSSRRTLAAIGLRRLFPAREIAPLQERALLDPVAEVRESCAIALCAAGDASVADRLAENLAHPSSIVRVHATEALGRMGYATAVEPLVNYLARLAAPTPATSSSGVTGSHIFTGRQIAYVQDYDVEVAQNASVARPLVNVVTEGSVLDVRVLSMQTYSVARERGFAYRALEGLTRAGCGKDTSAWLAWWSVEEARRREREQGVSATEAGALGK